MLRLKNRRRRRSLNTTQALAYQLDMSRRSGHLQGMILSDEDGVCLAVAGDTDACDEVAARVPLVGRKVPQFDGVLYSPDSAWPVTMRRFRILDTDLYMCAIGGDAARRDKIVKSSIGGASRILDGLPSPA